ncbi:MAG: protein kinase [Cyanobacteria bacterium HKST-UBA02]|nr:protein kinase [Cyanobacteria bacterium HKST-UBA02]
MEESLIAGRYKPMSLLGEGGAGQVFKCEDIVLSSVVAVKILHADSAEADLIRFQKEARAMARLDHPNIIKVLDFGLSEGRPFLVMELCEAESLASMLEDRAPLDFDFSYGFLRQIASAISYAHRQDVLHRDIKPSNVLLSTDQSGNLKARICDFGLAKVAQDAQAQMLTSAGGVIGTPAYISPEAVTGAGVDARSDIYSFGCMMFEILTGRLPFKQDNVLATMMERVESEAPSLADVSGREFPSAVEELVSRCLAREPEDRFQNAEELVDALDDAYGNNGNTPGEMTDYSSEQEQTEADRPKQSTAIGVSRLGAGIVATLVAICLAGLVIYGVTSLHDTGELVSVEGEGTGAGRGTLLDESISIEGEVDKGIVWTRLHGPCVSRDVSRVLGVKNLRYLRMTHDDLSDDGFRLLVEHHVKLLGLKLDTCILGDETMRAIGKMRTLEFLELNECKGLSNGGLAYFTNLSRLKDLELADTDSGDNEAVYIAQIPNLRIVNLSGCSRLTDHALVSLERLKNLEELKIDDDPGITADGLRNFLKNRPNCKVHAHQEKSRKS